MAFFKRFKRRFAKGRVAKKVKRYVKRALDANIEDKIGNFTTSIAPGDAQTNYNGSVHQVLPISQGDTLASRQGNIIRPKRMYVTWFAQSNTYLAENYLDGDTVEYATAAVFRLIIFYVSQQTAAATPPTVGTVLSSVGTALAPVSPLTAASLSNDRYKIIYDKVVHLDDGGGWSKGGKVILSSSLPRNVHYQGANTTDLGKNQLFYLVISDRDTGDSPSFRIGTTFWYQDA